MSISMPISSVQTATSARSESSSAAASVAANAGNYNAFLQLLVTQLRHQDPLKPMDPTETVTQLATFASVEQAMQTNSLLAALTDNSAFSQAGALIGRTLTSQDGKVTGVVKSVIVESSGLVAVLANGAKVPLGAGVTIS